MIKNSTVLRAYYMLNTLDLNYPLTSCWLLCKFPYVDSTFFTSTFDHPYQKFLKIMLNFQLHNRRYHEHFYQTWLGHGHCDNYCKICAAMDSTSHSNVTHDLQFLQLCESSDIFYIPSTDPIFVIIFTICHLILNHFLRYHMSFIMI
jgi:hypothetical protein